MAFRFNFGGAPEDNKAETDVNEGKDEVSVELGSPTVVPVAEVVAASTAPGRFTQVSLCGGQAQLSKRLVDPALEAVQVRARARTRVCMCV